LNKLKNSIITEVKFAENKLSALQTETRSISGELKKFLNSIQRNIITKIEDNEPLKLIINESATGIIVEFKIYMQSDIVRGLEEKEPPE
jgi:predicted helicase